MQFQLISGPPSVTGLPDVPPQPPPAPPESIILLRQMVEMQRELVQHQRNAAVAQDAVGRWRAFLERRQGEYKELPGLCKEILPHIERAYLRMLHDVSAYVQDCGPDGLDNDFVLGEFLDRFGMRLGQLGSILSVLAPLAEAAPKAEE